MSKCKLLLVEDDSGQIDIFNSDKKRLEREKEITFDVEYAKSYDEAIEKLDKSYDGTIIDLRLDGDDPETYSGNQLIEKILKEYRIPIAIYTATPLQSDTWPPHVKLYKRSETRYREVLEEFYTWYQTGITKVVGSRGFLEEKLDQIFWERLLPLLDVWKQYSDNEAESEKAVLRFTVNHLMEYLDGDSDTFLPEEVYITPPIRAGIHTGSIVQHNENERYFVVLTPACDLVIRSSGEPKTSDILLCEIESLKSAQGFTDTKKRVKREDFLKNLANNNSGRPYLHFLPQTQCFAGGLINFRKIHTIQPNAFNDTYSIRHKISSAFIKDIVARFSTYYSRQGQPKVKSDWIDSFIQEWE